MKNLEKFGFPIAIGAAVIGIWAALRKTGTNAPTIVQGGGITMPSVPQLTMSDNQPAQSTSNDSTSVPASAGTAAQNHDYIAALSQVPSTLPAPGNSVPSYLNYNTPTNSDLNAIAAHLVASQTAPQSTCSCATSKPCSGGCDNTPQSMKFPDGAGGCLAASPQLPASMLAPALLRVAGFATQSAYDCTRPGSIFDLNCHAGNPAPIFALSESAA